MGALGGLARDSKIVAVGGDFSRDCGTTNISMATNCGSMRLVGGRITHAGVSNIVSNVNNFNKLFTPSFGSVRRPMLIDNASNMNAGVGLTFLLSGRSAVNVSTITVYMGSMVYYKTGPLFFLSCVTVNGGCPRGMTRVMSNVTRNYIRSNYTLVNNRATRRPNLVPISRCSITNFDINVTSGPGVVSNSGLYRNSMLLKLHSSNIRSGNFSLIEGVFSVGRRAVGTRCPRLSGALNRALLAPAGVCMGPLLTLVSGISMGTMSRVANNNFCRGVPHVLASNLSTGVGGSGVPILPVFGLVREMNGVPRRSVFGAFGVNMNVVVTITGRSTSGTLRILTTGNRSTIMLNRMIDNGSKMIFRW